MRARGRILLIVTAVVSSILGAVVSYLVLTIPNDLQAGAILRRARAEVRAGHDDAARAALARVIQQFPRTDAAAAATVALMQLENAERTRLSQKVDALVREGERTAPLLQQLQQSVTKIQNTPPPAPVVIEPPKPKPILVITPSRRSTHLRHPR